MFLDAELHLAYKIANTPILNFPFPHMYVENIFPDDFYSKIQENLLEQKEMTSLADNDTDNYGLAGYKERFIVGVNNFIKEDESIDIPILEISDKVQKKQIDELLKIKDNRNNQLVEEKLNKITNACKANSNLLPLIIDAALEYATLGEIVDSMKEVFGDWTEKAII